MKKQKCPFTGKKAERFCPALDTHISSKACGEKRKKEINCISDCQYLPDERTEILNEIPRKIEEYFGTDEKNFEFEMNFLFNEIVKKLRLLFTPNFH